MLLFIAHLWMRIYFVCEKRVKKNEENEYHKSYFDHLPSSCESSQMAPLAAKLPPISFARTPSKRGEIWLTLAVRLLILNSPQAKTSG